MKTIITSATRFQNYYYITGRIEGFNYYVLFFETLMNEKGVCKVIKPSNYKLPIDTMKEIEKQRIKILLGEFPSLPKEFINEILLLNVLEELGYE